MMIFVTCCCRYQQKYQQKDTRHWLAKKISKRSAAGTVHAVLVSTIARPESNPAQIQNLWRRQALTQQLQVE
jgi:hypothetical protein